MFARKEVRRTTPPSWASTDLVDEGTRRVVENGLSIVHDPERILARLTEACRLVGD
jgi:hypothetical protein